MVRTSTALVAATLAIYAAPVFALPVHTSARSDTAPIDLSIATRAEVVTGIESVGGSPFGSIPSKLAQLFSGLFSRGYEELDGHAKRELMELLESRDFGELDEVSKRSLEDLFKEVGELFQKEGIAARAEEVTGIESVGGSPFGSIPNKLIQLVSGLFSRDFEELDEISKRAEVVTGIESAGGSPFGSIPSKLLQLVSGLFSRDFEELDEISKRDFTDLLKEAFEKFLGKGGITARDLSSRDLADIFEKVHEIFENGGVATSEVAARAEVVTGIESAGGSPFGSIPNKLIQLVSGLFSRDFEELDEISRRDFTDLLKQAFEKFLGKGGITARDLSSRDLADIFEKVHEIFENGGVATSEIAARAESELDILSRRFEGLDELD